MEEKKFRKTIAELRIAIAAVDVVLFSIISEELRVFLIEVDRPPFYSDMKGLPGGIIGTSETADVAALRHLKEKAQVVNVHLEQLFTFSDPQRDKRSRAIAIAYIALVATDHIQDMTKGSWYAVNKLPKLAYDHDKIVQTALERLRGKITYTTIARNLLPKQFTLTELQGVYEIILDEQIDKRNFRKKVLSSQTIEPIEGKQKKTMRKPAQLYRFI